LLQLMIQRRPSKVLHYGATQPPIICESPEITQSLFSLQLPSLPSKDHGFFDNWLCCTYLYL
jgi:hypothetical protein